MAAVMLPRGVRVVLARGSAADGEDCMHLDDGTAREPRKLIFFTR
jgi:hypothetical protein